MKKRRPTKAQTRDKKPASRLHTFVLVSVCGLTLLTGFFFAARQHFSSMDYGMKNSRLRKQIDELEAEKRRLLLAREVSLSPAEIKKAARRTGLTQTAAPGGELAQVVSTTKDKAVPAAAAPAMKPMVIKTSAVSPAGKNVPDPNLTTAKLIKPVKSTPAVQ